MKLDCIKLKCLLIEKRITQKELASLVNVTQHTMSVWTLGKQTPKFDNIQLIADALGIDPLELIIIERKEK